VKSLLRDCHGDLNAAGIAFFRQHTRMAWRFAPLPRIRDRHRSWACRSTRVIALTFFVGGHWAPGRCIVRIPYSLVNPYSGFVPGMKAFTAAVLGGIG
jgi:branched-chain amino acid transport system permease protein